MNDVNSKQFKKKYQKSKYKLRQWEDKFLAENGRLPTRADIKVSPSVVRESYKLYWKLKTQILEAQILSEDIPENHVLLRSKSDGVLKEHTNTLSEIKKKDVNLSVCKDTDTSKENVCASEVENDPKAWGTHLNRSKTTSVIGKEKSTFLNDVRVERLFKGSSFKKRNPRKALSLTKKNSNKSVASEDDKSIGSQSFSSVMSPFFDSQDLSFSLDQSLNDSTLPLEPSLDDSCSGAVFSVENNCTPDIKALITSATPLSPILNKSDNYSVDERTPTVVQPVSLIQAIATDGSITSKPVRSLDAGWVERCSELEKDSKRKSNSDSGFDSMESFTLPESDVREDGTNGESDDDIIGSSDNEVDHYDKLSRSFSSQKRKPEVTDEIKSQVTEKTIPEPEVNHIAKKIKLDPYEFVVDPPKQDSKKTILENKIKSGTLNENYVKINLKKKVFVRGKKNFNFGRYKKKQWKNKKKNLEERESGGLVQCYKCGEVGHFSRYCEKEVEDKLLPVEEDDEGLPTLEEVEAMAKEKLEEIQWRKKKYLTFEVPVEESSQQVKIDPIYPLREDGSLIDTPIEVFDALEEFGHSNFRPGQEKAIMRILSGQSTLLTIATGSGKSLCYQLPAYLYAKRSKCITLVVSPLVSLMEDQVSNSSSFFKVGCLHTNQTEKQRQVVLNDAKEGKLFALLISPEAVVSGDSFTGLGSIFKQLPPIAFACIDEIHCISQWSHNFRPSYLMISKVLREKLNITTILGLTATATISTIKSIVTELHIPNEGVIKDVPLPDNLCLSISKDENKDEALLQILQSPRFKDANAILIYCTRRDECERLAVLIRTVLHDPTRHIQTKSKRLSWNAESYHAGMAAARRKQVQKAFMCGNLRIVVATVAFGMGINKLDIRGVIHYNMPKDFESYVQEVGRAGRDGMLAHCHLFLDPKGRDLNELRRHVHANSVDRFVLRKLLQRVFIECKCKGKSEGNKCDGHEVGFDCKETIQTLDIPEENVYTLLCYLELHEKKFVKVLSPVYITCKIKSYKGMKSVHAAARKCAPLAYACALQSQPKKEKTGGMEFNIIDIANKLSWDSGLVKSQLKNIEWELTANEKWKKTGIMVEFSGLGFRVCSRGDMSPSELDEALDYLNQRVESEEKKATAQLNLTFSAFDYFALDSYRSCTDTVDEGRSEKLKAAIRMYFETETIDPEIPLKNVQVTDFDEEAVAADIRVLLCNYRDNTFNGRAVARIFHGIQSPNYPASLWYKCRFWRHHIDKDFNKISRIATREILRMKV